MTQMVLSKFRKPVRIVGDGTPSGTQVYDAETGDPIQFVKSVMIVGNITTDNMPYIVGEMVVITGLKYTGQGTYEESDEGLGEEIIPINVKEINLRK